MRSSIAFAAALAAPLASAGALTYASGGVVFQNNCDYDIPIDSVPDGTSSAKSSQKSISQGGQYSEGWVGLDVDGGWSLKMSMPMCKAVPMQFEYNLHPDGNVWWDLSFVNWEESGCDYNQAPPRHFSPGDDSKFYRYPADNDHGMQVPVKPTEWVTMTICAGSGGGAASAPAPTTEAAAAPAPAPTTTEAPAPAPTTLQTSAAPVSIKQANVQAAPAPTTTTQAPAPPPATTPATTAAPVAPIAEADDGAVVVTEFETKIVTAVVTEVANARRKRHAHGHHHGHPQ